MTNNQINQTPLKNKKYILAILLFVSFCFHTASSIANPIDAQKDKLIILHTNDTHSRLLPEEKTSHGKNIGGILRRNEYFKKIKNTGIPVLIVDAGDIFQGSPFYSFFKGQANFKAAALCGYDATTIGNHEPDNGFPNLFKQQKSSGIRILSANIFSDNTKKTIFEPYKILIKGNHKIAIIGSIGDDTWAGIGIKSKAGMYSTPQIETVRKISEKLREKVDLIVVLSHAGINDDKLMAARIDSIDVIVGGHTHEEVHSPILIKNDPDFDTSDYDNGQNGTIVVQAGEHGIFVGNLELTLDEDGKIATYSGKLELMDSKYEPPKDQSSLLSFLVKHYEKMLSESMNRIVGFSEKGYEYPKDEIHNACWPMGSLAAESMRKSVNADICLMNSGGIRAGISSGKISCKKIITAMPYDNSVVTFDTKGSDLKRIMELLCQFHLDGSGFQYAGITATFDLKSKKAKNILVSGKPIEDNKVYKICTSSYVSEGNLGGDQIFKNSTNANDSGIFMRDAGIKYFETTPTPDDFQKSPIIYQN